jgi:hypothetical protein
MLLIEAGSVGMSEKTLRSAVKEDSSEPRDEESNAVGNASASVVPCGTGSARAAAARPRRRRVLVYILRWNERRA